MSGRFILMGQLGAEFIYYSIYLYSLEEWVDLWM